MPVRAPVKPVEAPTTKGLLKYCKGCFYPLRGLEIVGVCPECGREYDLGNFQTYSYDSKPKSRWRRLFTGRLRYVPLLLMFIIGHFMFSNATCMVFLAYPIWMAVTTYFILDLMHRIVRKPAGFTGAVVGFVIAAGLGMGLCRIYMGSPDPWVGLISGIFGFIGGVFLVQAELSYLRES